MPSPIGHLPYNTNGEGGRPVIYTDEYIEKEADALIEWMKKPGNIVLNKFAYERGYSRQRFIEFAKVNQRFSDTLKLAKEWQENLLQENALTKVFSEGFTKFIMINNHGYSERTEQKVQMNATFTEVLSQIEGNTAELVKDDGE